MSLVAGALSRRRQCDQRARGCPGAAEQLRAVRSLRNRARMKTLPSTSGHAGADECAISKTRWPQWAEDALAHTLVIVDDVLRRYLPDRPPRADVRDDVTIARPRLAGRPRACMSFPCGRDRLTKMPWEFSSRSTAPSSSPVLRSLMAHSRRAAPESAAAGVGERAGRAPAGRVRRRPAIPWSRAATKST